MKGDEIVRACDQHSNKTVTLRKHVTKYKHMRKWKFEFLSKSESRDNKIARVNSVRITKSINLLSYRAGVQVRFDVGILELTARTQSIYREVYGYYYI